MTGLIKGWDALPRVCIQTQTTSASGEPRTDAYQAVPLAQALAASVKTRLLVRARDGVTLALSPADVQCAYLAPLPDGAGWQLVLSQDQTRRRRVKHPQDFLLK